LAEEAAEVATWISRDAGVSWSLAARGSFIYDLGDHGSIVMMAATARATNEVL
jgi:hypothetical protein